MTFLARCVAAFYLFPHDLMHPRQKRVKGTIVPHVLEYECARCGRIVGESTVLPHWPLLARLRRQVGWSRARSRRQA